MSSAARERVRGDELPPLTLNRLVVREAEPSPARGPERDRLAALAESRVRRNENAMLDVLNGYLDRVLGVTLARVQGPRARKNTRWWSDRVNPEGKALLGGGVATYTETKALEPGYVLPDKTIDEVGELVRPVAIQIVADSVADTARRLGRRNVGLAVFDQDAIDRAVEDAVRRMLGVAAHHAAEIRAAITDADATAENLDEVLDRVREAHKRGGNWVRLSGRTLATALGNDAALASARALGVTHVQWLSKRDERVRPSHRIADGQVRPIGEAFKVGRHELRFPGDPAGLPDTWDEVAGCRCGLLLAPVDADRTEVMRTARKGTARAAQRVLDDAAQQDDVVREILLPRKRRTVHPPPRPGEVPAVPDEVAAPQVAGGAESRVPVNAADLPAALAPLAAGPVTAPMLALPAPVAGYRMLDAPLAAQAGQWLSVPTTLALGLAVPIVAGALVLTVVVPAGYSAGVGAGSLVLPAGTVLEIVSVTSAGVVAQPVEEA